MTTLKAAEFLKSSGVLDIAKEQMKLTFKTLDFGDLPEEKRCKLQNALLTTFIERFHSAAAEVVAEKYPPKLLDDMITFYKSKSGKDLVFYNLMTQQKLNDEAQRI